MSGIISVMKQFAARCTACGACVECCPIVQHTDMRNADPAKVMQETLELFGGRRVGDLARTRIYTCLFCNTCKEICPEGLNPGLSFGAAKAILQEMGDPVPKGVAGVMQTVAEMIRLSGPDFGDLLITDPEKTTPGASRTILYTSCFGLLQQEALLNALKIVRRVDPTAKAFGGYQFCCGELQFIAGKPQPAEHQFAKLVRDLDHLAPQTVVMFCPTCNMNFDHHNPPVNWSRRFITDFVADHLDRLGPFGRIDAKVTVHDSCHYVRGISDGAGSPRKILSAIPGICLAEMENSGKTALCCGAYAITASSAVGRDFRARRMDQAKQTGAGILALYCPGCQTVLGSEGPQYGLEVASVLSLLARSIGI